MMPRLHDASGNEYFGLEAGELMDLVDMLARLLDVIDAPVLAEPLAALVGPDAGLALGDAVSDHLCELASCLGARSTRPPAGPPPVEPTRSTPTCLVCGVALPTIGHRRYCSPGCRATDWRRRHPQRRDCGAHCGEPVPGEDLVGEGVGPEDVR